MNGEHAPYCDQGCPDGDCPLLECRECGEQWPCEVTRLREEITRIRARQVAEVADRIDSRSNAMVVDLTEQIAKVQAAEASKQEALDRIRRVLHDGGHDESCGTQYQINPEPCDCWLADLREAIEGGES